MSIKGLIRKSVEEYFFENVDLNRTIEKEMSVVNPKIDTESLSDEIIDSIDFDGLADYITSVLNKNSLVYESLNNEVCESCYRPKGFWRGTEGNTAPSESCPKNNQTIVIIDDL